MKWKFGLFRPAQWGLMRLLPMVMSIACTRNAPRYEPEAYETEPIGYQEYIENSAMGGSAIEAPSKNIANALQQYAQFWRKFCAYYNYDDKYEPPKEVTNLLKDIDYKEDLILSVVPSEDSYLQNDFSAFIEMNRAIVDHSGQGQSSRSTSNRLPNRLCIFLKRSGQDGSWDKRKLVDTASITIRSNPVSSNSEKHCFSLTAFLMDIPTTNNHHLVVFVKADQNWLFYNDDSGQTALSTTEAMRLASERGTTFFYRKIT